MKLEVRIAFLSKLKNALHDFQFFFSTEIKEPYESCMKTSVLATLTAGSGVLLTILTISLFVTCSKLRDRKKESGIYDAYVNHKGQID